MGLDSFRESRHINRVRSADLTLVWTAQSYRPDVTRAGEIVRNFRRWSQLDSLCSQPIVNGRSPAYAPDSQGYPCLKTKHIEDMVLGDDFDPDYVTVECAELLKRFYVQTGTVLMNSTGTGSIGRCSIYLGCAKPLTNQHIMHIRLNPNKCDACFVAAYLNSWWGQRVVEGGITGSTRQLNLPNEHMVRLPVPLPEASAQRYIGDKVRQAERLRVRARRLESEFRAAVTFFATNEAPSASLSSRVSAAELGRNLNPGAHTPERRALRAVVGAAGGRRLEELADVESPSSDTYGANAPYVGLDAIDSATCRLRPSTAAAEAVAGTARLLREGPVISRLRPYLNKVAYIPSAIAAGIGSSELLLLRPKPGVDGWFLYGVLKLDSTVRQLNPVATGSTHPRVDREDVLELLVPWPDDQGVSGAKLQTAQACYFASAALMATSTTLVDQLLAGLIAEADLVAAQKAMDTGDRSADRAILQTLGKSGASGAPPVISDLDGLYALLDESESKLR